MRLDDTFPSKYLKASEIDALEQPFHVVISHVVKEMIGMPGEQTEKPVIYFQGAKKGMVCNKTNFERIALMYGDESDDWPGKEVGLITELASFNGKSMNAIRVAKPRRNGPSKQGPGPVDKGPRHTVTDKGSFAISEMKPADMDDPIPF